MLVPPASKKKALKKLVANPIKFKRIVGKKTVKKVPRKEFKVLFIFKNNFKYIYICITKSKIFKDLYI